jgi:DNA repair exonuclease SbcCD ATPase subunit
MIKNLKAFKKKTQDAVASKRVALSSKSPAAPKGLPSSPPPPLGGDEASPVVAALRQQIEELESENRRLEQDMDDQKAAFEARHSSIMAVLAQQQEAHGPPEGGEGAPPPVPGEEHAAVVEQLRDVKALLKEARERLDKTKLSNDTLASQSLEWKTELDGLVVANEALTGENERLARDLKAASEQAGTFEASVDRMQSTMNERAEEAAQTIDSLRQKAQAFEAECTSMTDRVARAEETSLKMTSACEQALREKDEALGTLEAVQGLYEADRAKTNSARKKVDSIRKDMAKVFRVCGAKSLEEVEAVVRERREFQVQVTMAKAETRAAEDELVAYKDALRRQLVDNVQPTSMLGRVKNRLKRRGSKEAAGLGDGDSAAVVDVSRFTVGDLKNLANNLMETLDERDARMKLKEIEKRELFDRIIALETKLKMLEKEGEGAEGGAPGDMSAESLGRATPLYSCGGGGAD